MTSHVDVCGQRSLPRVVLTCCSHRRETLNKRCENGWQENEGHECAHIDTTLGGKRSRDGTTIMTYGLAGITWSTLGGRRGIIFDASRDDVDGVV